MSGFLLVLLNALITYAAGHAIRLYPMWKTRDVKARSIFIYVLCITAFQCGGLLLVGQVGGVEMPRLNDFIVLFGLPQLIPPFFIFRRRVWQHIFLMSVTTAYGLTPSGISIYAAQYWFGSMADSIGAVVVLKIILTVLTLPLLLYVLKRLAENTHMGKATVFWRLFWLIPGLFTIITMLNNSFLTSDEQNISFVVMRLLSLVALVLVCYLLDMALRQAAMAEVAERVAAEAEARARIMAERVPDTINKGRLTLRITPMTAMLDGVDMRLSQKEFSLLLLFVENEGRAMSADYLYERVWGQPMAGDANAIKVTLSKLRTKIDGSGFSIHSRRGVGYWFVGA